MENKVSIDMFVYDSLMKDKFKYDLLLKAIFDSADIDLFDELRFDSEELQKAIKVLEPYKYYCKQTELINQKRLEEEEAIDND